MGCAYDISPPARPQSSSPDSCHVAAQAKQAVGKANPLSYINVLGDLAAKEGRPVGQGERFGTPTGQVSIPPTVQLLHVRHAVCKLC